MNGSPAAALAKAGPATAPRSEARALPYAQIAWFFSLLVVLFFPVLRVMVWEWMNLEEMGHAFFVPVVAGYVVWNERERILAQPVKPFLPAIFLIVWGFIQMALGFLGADFFVARTAFLISVLGVVWTLAGTKVVRSLAFAFLLLLFMIRIPLFLYQQMTFPLQLFASKVAAVLLHEIGIPVLRDGNVLELPSQKLQVIEACSGIRSLLSLSFLSLAYAYVFDNRVWMRPVLFLATIPIAIGANAFRVTLTGIVSEYKKEWTDGVFHSMEGWVMFMIALAALMATHRLVCRFQRPVNA